MKNKYSNLTGFLGKSEFCRTHLGSNEYKIVSCDKVGYCQECVDRVSDYLKLGHKVVIDNRHADRESRAQYMDVAEKYKIQCRCFVMTTSLKHTVHNIIFREVQDSEYPKVSGPVFESYKENYEEPTLEEGFSEIVRVNFVPKFKSKREKELYEMYSAP